MHDARPDVAELFSTAPQLDLRDLHDAPLPPPPPPFEHVTSSSTAPGHANPSSSRPPPPAKAYPGLVVPTTPSVILHIPPPPTRSPPEAADSPPVRTSPSHHPHTVESSRDFASPALDDSDDPADRRDAMHDTPTHSEPSTTLPSATASTSLPVSSHLLPARFIGDRRYRHARRPQIYITQSGHIHAPRASPDELQEWRDTVIHRIPEETLRVRTPLDRPFRSPDEVSDAVPFLWKMHPQDAVVAAHLLCSPSPLLCPHLLYAVQQWSPPFCPRSHPPLDSPPSPPAA